MPLVSVRACAPACAHSGDKAKASREAGKTAGSPAEFKAKGLGFFHLLSPGADVDSGQQPSLFDLATTLPPGQGKEEWLPSMEPLSVDSGSIAP